MIKVLHTESSEGWGGQEIRSLVEVEHLCGHPDFCASLVVSKNGQHKVRGVGYKLNVMEADIGGKSLKGLISMYRTIRDAKPHLVVCHSSTDAWLATIAVKLIPQNIKLVRFRHVRATVNDGIATRWLYSQADAIVTTSADIRAHLLSVLRLGSDRVQSLPTGVDTNVYKRGSKSDSRTKRVCDRQQYVQGDPKATLVLMVSTLRSWKGHRYVIEALQQLHSVRLLIVGDGPQADALQRLVLDLGLVERVFFLGFQASVRKFLDIADIFVQPSYANEGVSQSLLQACAMELPLVVSDIGGLNEVIAHEVNGLLVPPQDVGALVTSISRLITESELALRLGKKARETAIESHSLDVMFSRTLDLYRELLKK